MPVRQDGHLQDRTQMSIIIRCRSCGAEYDGRETKCPWCGTRTDAGAEREYMDKLSDVKEDLESLSGERGRARKELAWEKENFPQFNALYQDKRYEELTDLLEEALDQEQPVWNWRHYSFAMALLTLRNAEQCRELLEQAEAASASGGDPSENINVIKADLLFFELRLEKVREIRDLSEEDLAYLGPPADSWAEDRKQRFPMTEEALQEFYQEDWYVDYEKCREYVLNQTSSGG